MISTVSESDVDMLPAASLTHEYSVLVTVAAEVVYIERRSPSDRKDARIRLFVFDFMSILYQEYVGRGIGGIIFYYLI